MTQQVGSTSLPYHPHLPSLANVRPLALTARASEDFAQAVPGEPAEGQVGSASSPQVRVLIVDDRPGSRDGLRALLSTWSEIQIVGEATDGQEAVVMAEKYDPDVVLMDARMPTMDGLEATRLINHRCPNVNVIILTLYSAYHTNAMNAGAVAFLVKGCPSEELLKTIKTWGTPPAPACSAPTPSTPPH